MITGMGLESGQTYVRCWKLLGVRLWWPTARIPSYLICENLVTEGDTIFSGPKDPESSLNLSCVLARVVIYTDYEVSNRTQGPE